MTFTKLVLALACLISGTLMTQEAKVTQLLSKDLTNLPGKEGLMITVEYPPGGSDPYIATMHMGLFMCWKARS
jgi:hypothetical protein